MRFIMRNDFIIRPITNAEYEAEFGLTFRDFKDLVRLIEMGQADHVNSPWLHDSVSEILTDILSDFNSEDFEMMIEAQTNVRYKNAIRKHAIKMGMCGVTNNKSVKMTATAAAISA